MKNYEMIWRNKWLTAEAKTIDDMISDLEGAVSELKAMKEAGIYLDPNGGTSDDYAFLKTEDPKVAEKFGMHEEEYDEEDFVEEIEDE